jgi:hypothetical protein
MSKNTDRISFNVRETEEFFEVSLLFVRFVNNSRTGTSRPMKN